MKARVAGVWRNALNLYARVAGSWRQVRYQYVKVAGVWRRAYRADNALYDGNITMGYTNFAGVDNWGFSNANYGSASPTTLKDGTALLLAQVANDSRGTYGPRRWLQIGIPGNVPTPDISKATFGGITSVAVISVTYISAFNLTEILLGFNSQLPNTGTVSLKF